MLLPCWLSRLMAGRGEDLGGKGERIASRHLKAAGYEIIDRNRRVGRDEADIIALDPDGRTLVIVEVKTRADDAIDPFANIHRTKQAHLARIAARLQRRREHRDRPIRFDAVAVVVRSDEEPEVRHIEGAFESPF